MAEDLTILTQNSTLVDLFDGTDFTSKTPLDAVTFEAYLEKVEEAKELQRKVLDRDTRQNINDLPVETEGGDRILVDLARDTKFNPLFESATSNELKLGAPPQNTFLVVGEAFLGQSIFKYNFAVFDPRPNVTTKRGDRPIFPGFEPISSYSTKEDLLEYIYTTVYPTKDVPSFPNFIVNGHVIDGEVYNPLFDFRNYRLFGAYDLEDRRLKGYELYNSKPISQIFSGMDRGKYFQYNGLYYTIKVNRNSSGPEPVSVFNNVQQWVTPSSVKFALVTEQEYNINSALHVSGL